ncbi:MAG TPA: acetate--CoA ligase family protein [Pseudobacillus sp.]
MTQNVESYESIRPLLYPESVAILGASENKYKIGNIQLQALIDGKFQGEIYPIHPKAEQIACLKSYPTLADVPNSIDLVIFCVAYDQIKNGLIACAEKKVKAAIIFASGFSEAGEEGKKLQLELAEYAKLNNIRLLGPNCVGLVNTSNGLIGTFSSSVLDVPMTGKRGVGYISQSGAFGVLTYMAAAQHGINFNYFISSGNEMDTTLEDYIDYMVNDDEIELISGYIEGAKNPEKLKQSARKALEKKKPIVLMKTGRSDAGSRAAASHTGALAGSDKIYDAFFRQHGIIRVEDAEDVIAFTKLFNPNRLPKGKNTAIITSSGGRGINEADRCEAYGLNIVRLSDETMAELRKTLPDYASVTNPIDLTAAASFTNPEFFLDTLKVLVNSPEVDNILLTEFPHSWDKHNEYFKEFITVAKNSGKFIGFFPFPLGEITYPQTTPILIENEIAVVSGALNPVRALAQIAEYSQFLNTVQTAGMEELYEHEKIDDLLTPGAVLSESEASEVLARYGIPTTKRYVALSAEEAVERALQIGFPVVLKIDSQQIPHKTEADAIRLNVSSEEEVKEAFQEIMRNARSYNPGAVLNGVSVQEMLPKGIEVIIGAKNDEVFGPVIMAGLGGIFVELFKDIAFKVAPLSRQDAGALLDELQAKAILDGARGQAAVDKEAIIDVLLRVSQLMLDHKDQIKELDINPLIVYENGIKAADAMLVVSEESTKKELIGG